MAIPPIDSVHSADAQSVSGVEQGRGIEGVRRRKGVRPLFCTIRRIYSKKGSDPFFSSPVTHVVGATPSPRRGDCAVATVRKHVADEPPQPPLPSFCSQPRIGRLTFPQSPHPGLTKERSEREETAATFSTGWRTVATAQSARRAGVNHGPPEAGRLGQASRATGKTRERSTTGQPRVDEQPVAREAKGRGRAVKKVTMPPAGERGL